MQIKPGHSFDEKQKQLVGSKKKDRFQIHVDRVQAWQYGTLPEKRFYSLIHCEEALVFLIQSQEIFAGKPRKEN